MCPHSGKYYIVEGGNYEKIMQISIVCSMFFAMSVLYNWEMFSRLQQLKKVDTEEILWKEATFHINVQYLDGKLYLKSFKFTAQHMG